MPPASVSALSNPIILTSILSFIHADHKSSFPVSEPAPPPLPPTPSLSDPAAPPRKSCCFSEHGCRRCLPYNRWGVLARCARVDRMWFAFAFPLIWKSLLPEGHHDGDVGALSRFAHPSKIPHLNDIFSDAEEGSRRQMYADRVEEASLWLAPEEDLEDGTLVLGGVRFPRLRRLVVSMPARHFPPVGFMGEVEELSLASHGWYDDEVDEEEARDDVDAWLEQIKGLFPKLKVLVWGEDHVAHPGAMKRYRRELTGVRMEFEENVNERPLERRDW